MALTLYVQNPPSMVDGQQLLDEIEAAVGERPTVKRDGQVFELSFIDDSVDLSLVESLVVNHAPAELDQIDQLVAKARNVWAGTDSFTQAQAQKILAGLVLVVARYLR